MIPAAAIAAPGWLTMAYLVAAALFILSLAGLSHQETARRGNLFGIVGMAIALVATLAWVETSTYVVILTVLVIGGAIGARLAAKVAMTAMPELVAALDRVPRRASWVRRPCSSLLAEFLGVGNVFGLQSLSARYREWCVSQWPGHGTR